MAEEREGRGKTERGTRREGKGNRGTGEGKREGKRGGRERVRMRVRDGRGSLRHWRWEGIGAPGFSCLRPSPVGAAEVILFSGCPSVSACTRLSTPGVRPVSTILVDVVSLNWLMM